MEEKELKFLLAIMEKPMRKGNSLSLKTTFFLMKIQPKVCRHL